MIGGLNGGFPRRLLIIENGWAPFDNCAVFMCNLSQPIVFNVIHHRATKYLVMHLEKITQGYKLHWHDCNYF